MSATALDVFADLQRLDVRVTARGGRLVVDAPKGVVTPEFRERLAARKRDILAALEGGALDPTAAGLPGHADDDGWVPREWAEGVARLGTLPRPAVWPAARWRGLIGDAGRFVDRWGAKAAALGWSAIDVFGVDPVRPLDRVDRSGLVPLIDGGEIVATADDQARIRRPSGAMQTFFRRPRTGAVAVWAVTADTPDSPQNGPGRPRNTGTARPDA